MSAADFITALNESLDDGTFVKLTLGGYKGAEKDLKNIHIRKVVIKRQDNLSFTYRYKTRDIVKNYPLQDAIRRADKYLAGDFKTGNLFTTAFDLTLDGKLKKSKPTITEAPSADHNRAKTRTVSADKSWLYALGITDKNGEVYKNAQDKYRQINRYIEILAPLLKELPGKDIRIADMGAGKGYLTFALYDYLVNTLKLDAHITGVETRADLVTLCNKIAAESGFKNLEFVEGTIANYKTKANVLIALHACDTATDDAIAKGIEAGADLIVAAPCCHKQIRREMEKSAADNDVVFLTRHGIFMERQAEMVTDGMRALILEHHGYKTKVFEFVSDAHTAKNVMIAAQKTGKPDKTALEKLKDTKSYFGIGAHHLEKILKL